MNLFYKGYINTVKHCTIVKGKKVDFRPDGINALYGLEDNVIGHAIFKELMDLNKQDALEKVA